MTPTERILKAKQDYKIALNTVYQLIEIERKITNHYKLNPPPKGYISISYLPDHISIYYAPSESPFVKIKDLFLEDFETIADLTFIKGEFLTYIGAFSYDLKYFGIPINIMISPSSNSDCELKQISYERVITETKYQMNC